MRITKNSLILSINIIFFSFNSCNKFLSERPTKDGRTPENAKELVDMYNKIGGSNVCYYRTYISDDSEVLFTADEIRKNNLNSRIGYIFPAYFQREFRSEIASSNLNGGGYLWRTAYSSINTDNYVISMIEKVKGTDEDKKVAMALAKFDRAKNYFDLVTTYSLPYKPGVNDNDLGVVLRTDFSIEISSKSLSRSNLKDTYNLIETDLVESMIDIPDGNEIWKINKKAVYAFAARFYLMIGDYSKAEKYADEALARNNRIIDYTGFSTKEVTIASTLVKVLSYFYDKNQNSNYEIYKVEDEYYIEIFIARYFPVFPSKSLQQIYEKDTGDVRYLLFPTNGSGNFSLNKNLATHRYMIPYNNGVISFTFPNVSEMILIKAEVLAEKGDLQGAKVELNRLREKRIINYDPSSVNNLSSKDEVLDFIYDERRREKPFFLRGFDIRRLKAIKGKNIVIEKDFFEITETTINPDIPKKYVLTDNAYADFLSTNDILLSEGYLEQNKK